MEKLTFKKICFMNFQKLTNFPYIENDFDALTNYEVMCKIVEYLNQVIANNNEQNKAIEEQNKAIEEIIKYFENLDVQDEINNKLDEMAESGELAQIFSQIIDFPIKGKINVQQIGRFFTKKGNNIAIGESQDEYVYAQGFCIVDKTHYIQLLYKNDNEIKIVEYNPLDGSIYREQINNNMGHANSIMYKDGYLYVTPYYDSKIIKYDYNTFNIIETFELSIPTKYINKDTKTNKIIIGNDTSMYEWEIDTTNFTKLFDIIIPEFENQITGYLQDIACFNNFIYLMTSSYSNSKVIIFVFDLLGNIYTYYDLGTHNNLMYYGEGEGIDNIEEDFYLSSCFNCSIYNDYNIIPLSHFNPINNIFIKKEMYSNDSSVDQRIVNIDESNFYCDGSIENPFKYYFEFLIANSFVPYNLGMSLMGSKQPRMTILNENDAYIIDINSSCVINGLNINNSNAVLQGLKIITNDNIYNTMCYISRSNVRSINSIFGDSENLNNYHCLILHSSMFTALGNSYNSNNIFINNQNSLYNENSLPTTFASKYLQFQGKTIINPNTSTFSNNYAEITFNDNIKKLLKDSSRKQLYFMIHLNNSYTYCYFNIESLTETDNTSNKIIFLRDAEKIYSCSATLKYSANKISVSLDNFNKADGTQETPNYIIGTLNYKIIY